MRRQGPASLTKGDERDVSLQSPRLITHSPYLSSPLHERFADIFPLWLSRAIIRGGMCPPRHLVRGELRTRKGPCRTPSGRVSGPIGRVSRPSGLPDSGPSGHLGAPMPAHPCRKHGIGFRDGRGDRPEGGRAARWAAPEIGSATGRCRDGRRLTRGRARLGLCPCRSARGGSAGRPEGAASLRPASNRRAAGRRRAAQHSQTTADPETTLTAGPN